MTENDGQQVVEVMCDTADKTAKGIELLDMMQALLAVGQRGLHFVLTVH